MRYIDRNSGIEFRQYVDSQRDDAAFEERVDALRIGKNAYARMTDEEFEKLVDSMTLNKEGDSHDNIKAHC